MLAPSARTAVIAAAAAAFTGTAALGQQTASNAMLEKLEAEHAARLAACARISDHAKGAGCEVAEYFRHDQAVTAVMKQQSAAAKQEAAAAREKAQAAREEAAEHRAAREAAERKIAAHDRAATHADADIRCTADLKAARQSGVYDPAVARGILQEAKKSLVDYGTCNLARALCARMSQPDPALCRPS
jgi:hypothetical protein